MITTLKFIDVYQGENEQNIGKEEYLWKVPITQKAVMNGIVSTGLYTNPNGFWSYTWITDILHLNYLLC